MDQSRKWAAEFFGTMWLVLGGCGSAVLAGSHIGWLGVSLAFGLTVLTMAYTFGPVSGCHLNPAVSVGLVAAGRFKASELPGYVISQVCGAIVACVLIWMITVNPGDYAANGFAEHSPSAIKDPALADLAKNLQHATWYGMRAAFLVESLLTMFFLLIILGSTDRRVPYGFAPIPIGLGLTLIHLVGIPVTNTSVNPARSTGPAIFVGGWALEQLWLFWVAPIVGAVVAGLLARFIWSEKPAAPAA
jgi:aquaporin Z